MSIIYFLWLGYSVNLGYSAYMDKSQNCLTSYNKTEMMNK